MSLKMNSKVYKWCGVPHCGNTSKKTPNKLFVFVPQKKSIRDKWLELAKRDSFVIMATTHLYFCEDHFDACYCAVALWLCWVLSTFKFQLPNDMVNYMQYHLMGSVPKVRMKAGCLPTKFECQSDIKRKYTSDATYQSILKKQRKTLSKKSENGLDEKIGTIKQEEFKEATLSSSGNGRKKWLQLARRDAALVAPQSKMHFFDLPNDMENYTEYRVMGSVSQVRMRAGCMPTKFECQPDRRRRAGNERTRPLVVKRQRLEAIADCEREIEQARSAQSISNAEVQPGPSSGDSKGDVLNVQVNVSVGNTIENNDYYQHGTLNPCDSRYTETDRVSRNSCIKKECEDMSTEDLSESEDNEHVNIKTEPNVNCYEDYIINYGIKEDIDPEDQKFNRDVDIKSETMEEYEDETATNFCRPELQSIVQNSENYHEST
ncbi:uncharacterized protein [Atheta coriaria]|uniref:uncharacterized protein isoform X3 n=1 Tax=Dalotia coriaria TaxID=877792 RepID=UPI0031F3AA9F